MSVQVEKLEKNMAKLTIEVAAEEFINATKKAYNKNKSQISVPGFRKGKVPQNMVEKMYGAAMFYEEAANIVISETYDKAVEESGLVVVSMPKIDAVQMEKGKDFIYTAEVAVKPEVTLGEYKGVVVDRTEAKVEAEEIDAEIKKEQEQNAREVVSEEAAKDGDTVIIDFVGAVDGEKFDGGAGSEYPLVLGSNSFIPGFEEQLAGAKAGDDVTVTVTFPAEYQAAELAGKEAVFECHVHEVKSKEYPALDDEFAQDVSDFETFEDYKADVEKKLLEKKEEEAKAAKQQKVMDVIIENATMEIPDAMVETQAGNMVEEYAQRLQYQGLSMEQYFQFTGLDAASFREQLKPQALKNIQSRLVLEAIVKAENLTVSDEEYEAELVKMAENYKMELEKVKEFMDANAEESIKADMAAQNAVELVTEAAIEK